MIQFEFRQMRNYRCMSVLICTVYARKWFHFDFLRNLNLGEKVFFKFLHYNAMRSIRLILYFYLVKFKNYSVFFFSFNIPFERVSHEEFYSRVQMARLECSSKVMTEFST